MFKHTESVSTVCHETDKSYCYVAGLSQKIKDWFENLSGFSFDDVRVHYNSDKPSKHGLKSYSVGNEVYLSLGEEKRLGYELAKIAKSKRGGIALKPALSAASAPIQFWNLHAHLESLNTAIEKSGAYMGTNNPFKDENLAHMRSGNLWNDLGENVVKEKDSISRNDKIGFGIKYKFPWKITSDCAFIDESHHGDLQYLHCMKSKGGDGTTEPRNYAMFAYRIAKDPEDGNLVACSLSDLQQKPYYQFTGADAIFNKFKKIFNANATLFDVTQIAEKKKKTAVYVKAHFLGSLAHVIQDSFCASHALRGGNRCETGKPGYNPKGDIAKLIAGKTNFEALEGVKKIIATRNYSNQDDAKHEISDRMVESHIEETPGLQQATNIVEFILSTMGSNNITGQSLDKFFDILFDRFSDRDIAPTGRAYRKKNAYLEDKVDKPLSIIITTYTEIVKINELADSKTHILPSSDRTEGAPCIFAREDVIKQLKKERELLIRILEDASFKTQQEVIQKEIRSVLDEDLAEIDAELAMLRA